MANRQGSLSGPPTDAIGRLLVLPEDSGIRPSISNGGKFEAPIHRATFQVVEDSGNHGSDQTGRRYEIIARHIGAMHKTGMQLRETAIAAMTQRSGSRIIGVIRDSEY